MMKEYFESLPLPQCAVRVNGEYLEKKIIGYRTSSVSGRESFENDIQEWTAGDTAGARYLTKKQKTRDIEIVYGLTADTLPELKKMEEDLAKILITENSQFIFDDEPNVYFTGTVSNFTSGRLNSAGSEAFASAGTITVHCSDPHRYSTTTKSFKAVQNSEGVLEVTIDNGGSVPAPVNYTVTHNHDNGYLGFVSENGILQTGRIQEVDKTPYKQSENLINTNDFSNWERDTGTNIQDPAKLTTGKLVVNKINGRNCLMLEDAGSGTGMTPHGGMITIDISPDSEGNAGSSDFYCWFNAWFETGMIHQIGTLGINLIDEDNKLIFSYIIEKVTKNVNSARVTMSVGGNKQNNYWTTYFPPTMYNDHNPTNESRGAIDILKQGGQIGGYYWGVRHNINVPELKDKKCKRIQIYIGKYGTSAIVTRMYLREFKFQKLNVEKWSDNPNRYPKGSKVEVIGTDGNIYTDGILRMDDEIKGSKYTIAPPGKSKVQIYYSDFSVPVPDVTAEIREAWI